MAVATDRMPYTNLNTAAFDGKGRIWFTGQNGMASKSNSKTRTAIRSNSSSPRSVRVSRADPPVQLLVQPARWTTICMARSLPWRCIGLRHERNQGLP